MGRLSLAQMSHRMLESPSRREIAKAVQDAPGISMGELRTRTGYTWGTLCHHISALANAGIIETTAVGRRRLVHPRGFTGQPAGIAAARASLRGRTARSVAHVILTCPNIDVDGICRAVGCPRRVVYYQLRQLERQGLVQGRAGRRLGPIRPTQLLYDAQAGLA